MFDQKHLKIFIVIFFAYIISTFSLKAIFIANSPKIRNDLEYKINYFAQNILQNNFLTKRNNNISEEEKNIQKIAAGVYAQTISGVSVKQYRLNEIEWVEHIYIVNGKEIKLKIAKGDEVLSQETVEHLFSL